MIISELCANGDLFDYVRNVSPPSLYKVVRYLFVVQAEGKLISSLSLTRCWILHGVCSISMSENLPSFIEIASHLTS